MDENMDENILTLPAEDASAEDKEAFVNTVLEKVPGLVRKTDYANTIRIPGEDAGKEDLDKFHKTIVDKVPSLTLVPDMDNEESVTAFLKRLGMPEDGKYADADLSEYDDDKVNKAIMDQFKEVAKKAKLTQKQFDTIMKETTAVNVNAKTEAEAKREAEVKVLKDVWGSAFDSRVNDIKNFLDKTDASQEVKDFMQNASPAWMQWMYDLTVVASGKEGKDIGGNKNTKTAPLTPDEARAKIDEIRNNKEHAYHNPSHPGHAAARARMRKLYEMLPGGTDIVAQS